MTHIWKQTISIHKDLASKLIETQFDFAINSIQMLDEGWDNAVYLVNETLIFRFPRREFGIMCMENEITLLPIIKEQVFFPFSYPRWIGSPSEQYPYPFAGYSMLLGKPLSDATLTPIDDVNFAKTLAFWLRELHAIQVKNEYLQLIKGDQTWRLNVNHRVQRCKDNFSHYEQYYLQATVDKQVLLDVIDFISHFKFKNKEFSFLHGDLYSRHIIVDPNNFSLKGLIDWGDTHIGHPGIDLAVGMIFTKKSLESFLDTYERVDHETIKIMYFHAFCHAMSFLPYAYEQNNKSFIQWAFLELTNAIEGLKNSL